MKIEGRPIEQRKEIMGRKKRRGEEVLRNETDQIMFCACI